MAIFLYIVPFYIIDIFGIIIGNMIYYSHNWRREAIEENIFNACGKKINSKKIFINMTINFFDFIKFYYKDRDYLISITRDFEYNDFASKKNKMLLTAHYGNWELAGLYITRKGGKFVTIAESKGPGIKLFNLYKKLRSREGMIVLRLENINIAKQLNDYIKEKFTPVLLMDRDISDTGIIIKMRNKYAQIPKGPYFFAKTNGLDYFVAFMRRIKNKKFRYEVRYYYIASGKNMKIDAQNCANKFTQLIEKDPYNWFAFDMKWEDK